MGGGGGGGGRRGECGRRTPYTLPQGPPLRCSDYFMTSVLSFPRYAITYVGCHVRQTGLQNLYTPYLYIGHMQVNTLDHVYGRCILRWHNLTSRYNLSSAAEATPVRLVGQSLEGVPGLPLPSIHSPPMTCLRFRLSIYCFTCRYTLRL